MLNLESILDQPREGLDPAVWQRGEDGKYVLTDLARKNIRNLVEWAARTFGFKDPSVRITGSITSNQWKEDSDIDVHITFRGLDEDNADSLNKLLRAEFEENYKDMTNSWKIVEHPLEVYFQPNPYQDMMSVGCYDFNQDIWLVGPDFKPLDFDPYSEYFDEDMEYVKDVMSDIRSVILECREAATVVLGTKDGEFREKEYGRLVEKMKFAADIYASARQCRKAFSSPTSVEDALRKRDSRKWKVADSSFKLMDKFGYLKVLKGLSTLCDRLGQLDEDTVAEAVVSLVDGQSAVSETVEESIGGFAKCMLLASFVAIPGILPQEALAKELMDVKATQMKIDSPAVQKGIFDACADKADYGGYTAAQVVNMVARTLFAEARGESSDGRKAVLSVILNRSGGERENIPAVIKERYAFSCWNAMTESDWKDFKVKVPSSGVMGILKGGGDGKTWRECVDLATELFDGRFQSTIGDRNSYLNPKTASRKARDSWGK